MCFSQFCGGFDMNEKEKQLSFNFFDRANYFLTLLRASVMGVCRVSQFQIYVKIGYLQVSVQRLSNVLFSYIYKFCKFYLLLLTSCVCVEVVFVGMTK